MKSGILVAVLPSFQRPLRRVAVALAASSLLLSGPIGTPPIVLADYSGQCDFGTVANNQYYWGWAAAGSTTGAIYDAYSDITFGQDLVACAFPYPNGGGTFVEGSDLNSKSIGSGIVQIAIGQAAGSSTTFWYTPSDTSGGAAVPATWYPWTPVIGHKYRQFIWETVDSHERDSWEFCIADLSTSPLDERCSFIPLFWGDVYQEYQSYETQNTNDQMGPKCCVGAPLTVTNMHYQPYYQGNRSYVGPLSGTNMFVVGSPPSYYKWEWMNSTTWEAYTNPH